MFFLLIPPFGSWELQCDAQGSSCHPEMTEDRTDALRQASQKTGGWVLIVDSMPRLPTQGTFHNREKQTFVTKATVIWGFCTIFNQI